MTELSREQKISILKLTRRKIEAGHMPGSCFKSGDENAANPDESFCLRGAIERAAKQKGMDDSTANRLSYGVEELGLDLDGDTACSFSDDQGKEGCLRVIDQALAAA